MTPVPPIAFTTDPFTVVVLGPVVQSVVSLTSSKGHFVNCFSGFNIQYSEFFC